MRAEQDGLASLAELEDEIGREVASVGPAGAGVAVPGGPPADEVLEALMTGEEEHEEPLAEPAHTPGAAPVPQAPPDVDTSVIDTLLAGGDAADSANETEKLHDS